jgi:serine/threonine-protein kinase
VTAAEPKLIGPVAGSTPPDQERSRPKSQPIPGDLLRAASHRLGIISLIGSGLWAFGLAVDLAGGGTNHHAQGALQGELITGLSLLVSLGLFFYSRKRDREPEFIINLGLGYLVLMGFALGQLFHGRVINPGHSVAPVISWIGILVLTFAAIVPSTPLKIAMAGLVAVSGNPLGMFIAQVRGHWDFGPPINAFRMHYPDYLLAGIAVVISHVVTRLGQQVAKAREMGSYQLGELLGSGGMGEVYRATHRMLARPAAVKLIRPEMLGGTAEQAKLSVARFRREAEVAATLRSPHTVALYDFGQAEDQTLYFVMELLDGMDLETLVRDKGPVPAARAIYILRQVCESLEEAHARGLVHRDIKPANIHIGVVGLRHDVAKVLDFGLVKRVEREAKSGERSLETAAGVTPGTPAYLAPEMVTGGPVDGRADLYALGCVAYYLLTGSLVFEGNTAIEMVVKHFHEEPVAPSRRTSLVIPEALDRLVLACLAKKPEHRPTDAAALSVALAAIDIDPPWTEEQAMRWWRDNRPSLAAIATAH